MKIEGTSFANEQLLNNLEEGVIIVEKDCSSVLFLNTAAKSLASRPNFELSKASDLDDTPENYLFNWDKEMFAEMSKEIFTQDYNVDPTIAIQRINRLSEYQSIK